MAMDLMRAYGFRRKAATTDGPETATFAVTCRTAPRPFGRNHLIPGDDLALMEIKTDQGSRPGPASQTRRVAPAAPGPPPGSMSPQHRPKFPFFQPWRSGWPWLKRRIRNREKAPSDRNGGMSVWIKIDLHSHPTLSHQWGVLSAASAALSVLPLFERTTDYPLHAKFQPRNSSSPP